MRLIVYSLTIVEVEVRNVHRRKLVCVIVAKPAYQLARCWTGLDPEATCRLGDL